MAMITQMYKNNPPTLAKPWNLVVYYDELVPGDPLRLDQARKSMSVYVAIRELGPIRLKHDRSWFPTVALRVTNQGDPWRVVTGVEGIPTPIVARARGPSTWRTRRVIGWVHIL